MRLELEQLKEKLYALKELQDKCSHNWVESTKNKKQEVWETRFMGVDCFPLIIGDFQEVTRYDRICSKCGKKDYNNKIEIIPASHIKRRNSR